MTEPKSSWQGLTHSEITDAIRSNTTIANQKQLDAIWAIIIDLELLLQERNS